MSAFGLPIDVSVVLIGAVMAALLVTLIGLIVRGRTRRGRPAVTEPTKPQLAVIATAPVAIAQLSTIDGPVLLAAIDEASADGPSSKRLPGLYLSLAQWQIQSGEPRAAQDVLRKCIRSATTAGMKDAHARARVTLGDLVQASGDPATACEHWQIARQLFHELRLSKDFEAVDARMLRNGCPTDWVLTDF